MMIKCQKCGFENQMGAIFCRGCGEKIDMSQLNPDVLAEKKREAEKAEKGGIGKKIRNLVGILLLLAIIALGVGMFLPYGLPKYQAPAKEKIDEKTTLKFENCVAEKPYSLPEEAEFSEEELNLLFKDRFLTSDEAKSGTYAIENVQCKIDGGKDELTVLLFTKLSGKLPVLFQLTGVPKPGSGDSPVDIEIKNMKMGYIPMPPFCQKVILNKFTLLKDNAEIKRLFARSKSIEIDDGEIVFKFNEMEKAAKVPEAAPAEPQESVESTESEPEKKPVKRTKKSNKKKKRAATTSAPKES